MNQMATIESGLPAGDIHDFDFLHGNWSVDNNRLRQRFSGCTEWDRFHGVQRCEPRLGGLVNIDEINCPTRGFSGMSIRLFDLSTRCWTIYRASSTGAVLSPPVRGGFAGDRGVFTGTDSDGGTPVAVRFEWLKRGPVRARWSQAFSRDGVTWETNWVMDFTRCA